MLSSKNRKMSEWKDKDPISGGTQSNHDSYRSTPVETYFSPLRNFARRLDHDIVNMGQEIEDLQYSDDSSDPDGAYAKNFMQHARKDMKTLKSDVRNLREDLVRRSSTVIEVGELLTTLLDSYSERLQSVETFMEDYGYVRPDLLEDESPDGSFTETSRDKVSPLKRIVPGNGFIEACMEEEDENVLSGVTSPPTSKNGVVTSPRTPRLEDFGLSEYTLTLFSKKREHDTPKQSSSGNNNTDRELQSFGLNHQQYSLPGRHSEETAHTPLVLKSKDTSYPANSEIHTPQPEDFGLPSHLVKNNLGQVSHANNKNFASITTYPDPTTSNNIFSLPSDSSPKLERDSYFAQKSSCVTNFDAFMNDEEEYTYMNKENFVSNSKHSPKTPELPELTITSRWGISEPQSPIRYTTESFDTTNTTSNTPELPKLTRDTISDESQCLPHEVSLLPTADQTPPMPVLVSKRHYMYNGDY